MRVRAIAILSPRANVIGALELATSPEGLVVTYLDGAYRDGEGVPIPFDRKSERTVPWEQVLDAKVIGNAVYLELLVGPGVTHRLLLVRFTFGQDRSPQDLRRRRILLRVFVLGAALMALSISALIGPRLLPSTGPLFPLGLGVFLATLVTLAGILSDRFLATGGHASALVREIFAGELLSTLPQVPREPGAGLLERKRLVLPSLDGILPRTTIAVVITLSGALLAAIVMAKWVFFGNHREAYQASERATPEAPIPRLAAFSERESTGSAPPRTAEPVVTASSTAAPPAPSTLDDLRVLGPCTCARADSPLWREPLPHLTPVVLTTRRFPHKNHEDIELELAVINNSDRPLGNISVLVEFFEADAGNVTRLTSVESRTVFFEGPLASGKAIKWHVEERGTTFKIHPPTSNGLVIDDAIGPLGEGAASAASFAELLTANNRPVRLHGAMMLAYLGDRRARPAIVELGEALRDSEGAYLRRVLEAVQDQVACQITLSAGNPKTFKACVVNQAAEPLESAAVTVRLLDSVVSPKDPTGPSPQIMAERNLNLRSKLEPKAGLLVEGVLDLSDLPGKPASYEAIIAKAQKPQL